MLLTTQISPPTEDALARAAAHLRSGALVAFPTETVYGLGADATNPTAVARIFEAKGRPQFNPLIVHVLDAAAATELGQFTANAKKLAAAFWPGPLTLVVKRGETCPIADLVSAGLPTLALRVPDHPIARALLTAFGKPLAAPSANRSGHVSATRAEHVAADLAGSVAMILDGGPVQHGLESTVLDVTSDEIVMLRPGAIPHARIEAVLGTTIARAEGSSIRPHSPGQLESHYATRAPLRLNAHDVRDGEALLAFGPNALATAGAAVNLSSKGDLVEAAANLFSALRDLDARNPRAIAVMAIPAHGLGDAINDRLKRAAAPRS